MAKAQKDLAAQLEGQLWHPHIGWQVLRRSKRYAEAVRRFVDQARTAEGTEGPSEYAMTIAGLDAPDIKTDRWERYDQGGARPLRVRMGDENVERMLFTEDGVLAPKFQQAITTVHCRAFVKEFGFVLRFPVSPKVENPNLAFLNFIWCMFPAAEYSSNDLQNLRNQFEGEQNRFSDFHIAVDWSFSDELIKRNLDGLVREILKQRKSQQVIPEKYRDQENFALSLRAFDLKESGHSWKEIGEEFWGDKGFTDDKLRDDAIAKYDSLKELIDIIENEAERRLSK